MNRKNLTAAVLAGLAGIAGIAGTAQAVNMNPDGLGQVLIYPYYTANDGNQTILSVVNTTNQAKAVKVRFLEGFNSREVLDFNLYMSMEDVWVAAIATPEVCAGDCAPTLYIPDTSCTVPYLYGQGINDGLMGGEQAFLSIAYTDNGTINGVDYNFSDGGPTGIARAGEGHFEIIEMGSIDNKSLVGMAVTHDPDTGMPANCALLTTMWTEDSEGDGVWIYDSRNNAKGVGNTNIDRNSGGLFGGAAIVNANNGTMYSYDAQALQGFDKYEDGLGLNFVPGTIYPSLNSGDQDTAWVFFGPPTNEAVELEYVNRDKGNYSVDAVSAVFMHSNIVNEYVVEDTMNAGTEWVVTFPTKNFYADWDRMCAEGLLSLQVCAGTEDDDGGIFYDKHARNPFTKYFGQTQELEIEGDQTATVPDCEVVFLKTWDREENTFSETPGIPPTGDRPPVVSPSLPTCDPVLDDWCGDVVEEVPFQLCNEVNVLRFGERVVFGTPAFGDQSLLVSVEDEYAAGWGRIRMDGRVDDEGLVGLPVTGFAAMEFENGYVDGGSVKANYGGLFRHKGLVSRVAVDPL